MNRIVPHQINYNWLKYTSLMSNALLYSSALLSLISLVIEILQFEAIPQLNVGLAIISVLYFLNEFAQSYIFYKAEALRNLDFIDNSFNTRFAEDNSTGYYSNDDVQVGVVKMGLNNFENVFFTKKVSAIMFNRELWKVLLVFVIMLIAIVTSTKVVVVVFQLALPFVIIQQAIKLYIYNCKVSDIFSSYKDIFSSTDRDDAVPLILRNVISYEKLLSWINIPLDSKIFHKMNNELSGKWAVIKNDIRLTR